MNRQDLRAQLRTARAALNATARISAAIAITRTLEQIPEFVVGQRVAGYWAVGGELPLHVALAGLMQRSQSYHLPVLAPRNELLFTPWHAGMPVKPNRYGIPEPECEPAAFVPANELHVVLVPLLGFDRTGNRLGSGGGYYDRSFAFLGKRKRPTAPLLVGIAYDLQRLDQLQPEPWDIRLDYIATESELIDCSMRHSRN